MMSNPDYFLEYVAQDMGEQFLENTSEYITTRIVPYSKMAAQAAPGVISTATSGLGIHGNSVNSTRPSQVYHHTFSDGSGNFKTYTGVGDVEGKRAWQSVSRIEKQNPGWSFYDSKTTIAPNRRTALMTEQVMMNQSRRVNGANSVFNKRNTGKRLLKKLNKIF